jgi:hypothetical protein
MRRLPEEEASGNSHSQFPRTDFLRKILGEDALLLSWPSGSKGAKKRWKHISLAETKTPAYRRNLESGNIGVALGSRSNGLCSIDLDSDEAADTFLALNPRLQESLRTRGKKGCNVWVRCSGEYPALCKLKSRGTNGAEPLEAVGEWRADGAQTIISGKHPTGCDYSFLVEAPPVSLEFEQIIWPTEWHAPCLAAKDRPRVEHRHSETQKRSNAETHVVSLFDVSPFVPTRRGQSDDRIFAMSRRNKRWERDEGRKSTAAERSATFDLWWKQAKDRVDPAMDYYAYRAKWLRACDNAHHPDDQTPLSAAWKAANENPFPPEATQLGLEPMQWKMQLLVALCYQLQLAQRRKSFFLTSRDAAALLGVAHTTVFYWLESLCDPEGSFRVLRKVSTGSLADRKANEYFYLSLAS